MFKKVATVAKLHRKDFKPADKTLHGYNCNPFRLDRKLELDVSFQDITMKTDACLCQNGCLLATVRMCVSAVGHRDLPS